MKYQKIKDYDGGGTILNERTSLFNLFLYCPVYAMYEEVKELISEGKEVMVLDGKIKAVSGQQSE